MSTDSRQIKSCRGCVNLLLSVVNSTDFFKIIMPLNKEQKQKIVEKLKEKINKQKSMVFVAVDGLKAADIFDLRKKLKETDCQLQVIKKTLANIAFKKEKLKFDVKTLEGQFALVFGFGDEVSPAKTAYQFSLSNENLKILGGFFEDKFRSAEEMIDLAKIPSKQELFARVVGSISSPISGFVNVLQANIKGLICVLKQIN